MPLAPTSAVFQSFISSALLQRTHRRPNPSCAVKAKTEMPSCGVDYPKMPETCPAAQQQRVAILEAEHGLMSSDTSALDQGSQRVTRCMHSLT